MTNLNYPLEDKSNDEVANYLGITEFEVKVAKANGATTYQEVHSYCKHQEEIREEKQKVYDRSEEIEGRRPRKKGKSKGPWGQRYFTPKENPKITLKNGSTIELRSADK